MKRYCTAGAPIDRPASAKVRAPASTSTGWAPEKREDHHAEGTDLGHEHRYRQRKLGASSRDDHPAGCLTYGNRRNRHTEEEKPAAVRVQLVNPGIEERCGSQIADSDRPPRSGGRSEGEDLRVQQPEGVPKREEKSTLCRGS